MRANKMYKRFKKLIVVAGFGLLLFGATQGTAYAAEAGPGVSTTQQGIQQSDRWEGTGDVWRVRNEAGDGYLTNSWFQDLDGSWYMLGADGVMFSGLVTDQSTGKTYLLNTNHDGTFGKMLTTDGVYQLNGVSVYLTFNQAHDGTYGAILSGLESVRSSGVHETTLPTIPTSSAQSTQSQTSNTSSSLSQNTQSQPQTSGAVTGNNMTNEEALAWLREHTGEINGQGGDIDYGVASELTGMVH